MKRVSKLLRDVRGATAIEYGLICALIFLAMVAGVGNFGRKLSTMLINVSTAASGAM